jgi:hypothetical protein
LVHPGYGHLYFYKRIVTTGYRNNSSSVNKNALTAAVKEVGQLTME